MVLENDADLVAGAMLSTTSLEPVRVPRELLQVKGTTLEEYVRNRLMQFIRGFALRLVQLVPQISPGLLESLVRETFDILPSPDYGQVPVEQLELQLVFRHDCMALGCNEPQCALCQHNSQRRCSVNFNKKYLVGDKLLAKCGAAIRIEVLDRATGKLYDGELSGVHLELFTLDGAAYDARFLCDAGRAALAAGGPDAVDAELDTCALLSNNKGQPLLAAYTGGQQDGLGKLIANMSSGRLVLPDLYLTDSSEALLSGRKPPFRLVVRARHADGRRLAIKHAVSEPFVVATRRVRASHKVEIPAMDDPVSKLEHMGRETVKKLADLQAAAAAQNVNLSGLEPEYCKVEKVGDFHALVARAEVDGQLRGQLQTLLKLPKDKWDEAAEHARRAVVPDSRLRAWLSHPGDIGLGHGFAGPVGLLFGCRMGAVDVKRPAALLQVVGSPEGALRQVEAVPQQKQTPAQRDLVRQLLPQAEAGWWAPGHTGWTVLPMDTQEYQANPTAPIPYDLSLLQGAASHAALHKGGLAAAHPAAAAHAGPFPPAVPDLAVQHTSKAPQTAAKLVGEVEAGYHQTWLATSGPVPVLDSPFGVAATAAAAAVSGQQGRIRNPAAAPEPLGAATNRQQQQQQVWPPSTAPSLQQRAGLVGPAGEGMPAGVSKWLTATISETARPVAGATTGGPQRPAADGLGLPTAFQLEQMMSQKTLTEDVVAAIAAAYEAQQCPEDIMGVLNKQMMVEQQALGPTAADTVLDSLQPRRHAAAGLKRPLSAAVEQPALVGGPPAPGHGSHTADALAPNPFLDQLRRDSSTSSRLNVVELDGAGLEGLAAADAVLEAPGDQARQQGPAATGVANAPAVGRTHATDFAARANGNASTEQQPSLDLEGLRKMWPSMQLDALLASARAAAAAALTSQAAAGAAPAPASVAVPAVRAGKGNSQETVLHPAPPLEVEHHMTQHMSLETASCLLAMLDSLQPGDNLPAGAAGPAEMSLDPAPSTLVSGLGATGSRLPSNTLAGLGDWLGLFKGRQGLAGVQSMSVELPSMLLQGANSLAQQDVSVVKDASTGSGVNGAQKDNGDQGSGATLKESGSKLWVSSHDYLKGSYVLDGVNQKNSTGLEQMAGMGKILAEIASADLQQHERI